MSKTLLRCHGCRVSVLDTFASLAGLSIASSHQAPISRAFRPPQRRALRNTSFLRDQHSEVPAIKTQQQPQQPAPETQSLHDPSSQPLPSPPTTDNEDTTTPWYLRVPTPTPPTPISPLLASQDLPPLPTNPPPILSPILSHLSISIGLDNLTLLDLRHLDPPPALGANLLMIIGTARSVKHLNVSADRFCRWLRSNYKLRPYADGLLGRNELKLKLRRRARKMKLAGRVGNTVAMMQQNGEGADDGITTGWICVNLGGVEDDVVDRAEERERERVRIAEEAQAEEDRLEGYAVEENDGVVGADGVAALMQQGKVESVPADGGLESQTVDEHVRLDSAREFEDEDLEEDEEEEEEYQNPETDNVSPEYVGFGSQSTAPRIVVQMFTEDKRLEMDLEGLWDKRNTKKLVRDQKADKALAAQGGVGLVDDDAHADLEEGQALQRGKGKRGRRRHVA